MSSPGRPTIIAVYETMADELVGLESRFAALNIAARTARS